MPINLKNLKIKKDIDRINILHWSHFVLIILSIFIKYSHGEGFFNSLLKVLIIIVYYKMFHKTLKQLYYTFWSFLLGVFFYLLISLINIPDFVQDTGVSYLYFLALVLLTSEAYILSSPIYYPIVRWWEFDFRYRHDLSIWVELKTKMEGRLTDLRRGAGCVLLFERLNSGEIVKIELPKEYGEVSLTAEIMSSRVHSVGREINYGVRFIFENKEEKVAFKKLSKLWRSELKDKKKMKFQTGSKELGKS
ncbi:MAG: PilZ domain-containing protein [Bdellovibrionales bacterium]|nr:PilZ domain-containing protein [Bdellovibrionales bacterium]